MITGLAADDSTNGLGKPTFFLNMVAPDVTNVTVPVPYNSIVTLPRPIIAPFSVVLRVGKLLNVNEHPVVIPSRI
jgi:hypothetical protein